MRTSWRYAELGRRVAGTAAFLQRSGARPGDRIGIAMHNHPGFLQLLYGCWHAGLCAVPMNAKLHPREFAYILDNAGMRLCFASPSLYPGIHAELPETASASWRPRPLCSTRWRSSRRCRPTPGNPRIRPGCFYTSGTTGVPKGAMLTHRNLLFVDAGLLRGHRQARRRSDAILHAAPLSHGSGLYGLAHFAGVAAT